MNYFNHNMMAVRSLETEIRRNMLRQTRRAAK